MYVKLLPRVIKVEITADFTSVYDLSYLHTDKQKYTFNTSINVV